jgi:hypothetical protein
MDDIFLMLSMVMFLPFFSSAALTQRRIAFLVLKDFLVSGHLPELIF